MKTLDLLSSLGQFLNFALMCLVTESLMGYVQITSNTPPKASCTF